MEFDTLHWERREAVACITLARPDKLNALSIAMVRDLRAAAAAVAADAGIRAVLLTGRGRAFCSGADIAPTGFLEGAASLGQRIGAALREDFNPMVAAWHALDVPVIVAVNGIAAGAGVSVALMGDIVLAAHSATFILSFARIGLMPDLGSTFHLPRLVGNARAKGLALLGEALPAADAAAWGLIWACVDDEALLDRALSMAQRLAGGPGQAFRHIKTVFAGESAAGLPEQLEIEAVAQARLGDTQDFAEGLLAFRGKRSPVFTGR